MLTGNGGFLLSDMKDAYYFPHDANACDDDKILQLRSKYGWEGYGLYWAIIEKLRNCKEYKMNSQAIAGLSQSLNYPKEQFEMFFDYCFEIKLLSQENGYFFSDSLCRRMEHIDEIRERLSDAGKKGAEIRWGSHSNPIAGGHSNPIAVKESKGKEIKEKNSSIGSPMAHLTDSAFIDTLKNSIAYKHIDIDRELAKIDAWILTHKGKQKTRKFIVAWLNRIDKPLEPEARKP